MVQMYKNWAENDKHIENVNFQNLTYTLGHNQFSGMSGDEFREYLGYSKLFGETYNLRGALSFETVGAGDLTSLPKSIDWVELGAVTSVKDQGQCGSCWSFSTTGALEGAYYLANGELMSFSEQQLVDCDNWKNGGRDHGCNGGLMDNAFNWIGKNAGLCTETGYPYVSGTTKTSGDCTTSCSKVTGSSVATFVDVEPSSDDAMMTAVAKQPVSVAIEADQKDFQLYKSGVFTSACGTNLDHGVLVVGYGTMDSEDYYKVKNSWASTWGADGYIYLGRGSSYNNGDGQCGVLLEASYPVL
jgi:C1A family cysteine protease